jgi:superoxide oxidase
MAGARYSGLSIGLHWLMLALMALTYAFVELREIFERGTPGRSFMRHAHFSLGLLVLATVLVRIVARLRGAVPPIVPAPPRWQHLASKAAHLLLYALMIGMPLAGWLLLSLRGDPVVFFGLTLPPLAAENETLAKELRGWHGDIGRAGYALIGLHAAAALAHHYLWRDNTLRRMLPAPRGG